MWPTYPLKDHRTLFAWPNTGSSNENGFSLCFVFIYLISIRAILVLSVFKYSFRQDFFSCGVISVYEHYEGSRSSFVPKRISILLWLFNAGCYFILTSLGEHWSGRQMNLIMAPSPLCMILTCCERCFSGWGKYLWNARCKARPDKANFSPLNGHNAKQGGQ